MAGLPTNSVYKNPQGTPIIPTNMPQVKPGAVRYNPSNTYKYLAQLGKRGTTPQAQLTPPTNPLPGTPEYESAKEAALLQYGQLLGEGSGVPLGTQFLPPENSNISSPIPVDYGTFATPAEFTEGGEKLSWGTPVSPVIKNIEGDVSGQYVEDITNPDLLVKTVRGKNSMADQAILQGRPGFMYQIDHIMPLALGGADTLANRQVLTYGQWDAKNRAQAVPYTLYAYGQISLKEARDMAMKWKDRDLTDVPLPNSVGLLPNTDGRTGLQIAKDTASRWANPTPKIETLREKIGKIPEAAKNFGEGWLPDPIREFLKGTASGFTLGFIPYEQDEGEGIDSKVAGIAGMAIGGIGSFMLGEGFLSLGLRGLGLAAKGSVAAYRGVAAARAIETGLISAETAAELAGGAKTSLTVFKTLNKVPGYLQNVFLEGAIAKEAGKKATGTILSRMGKLGATSALLGQGSQFVQNKFNPYTISGQAYETDAGLSTTIKRMVGDFAMGSAVGVLPPTLKGTAGAVAMPLTLGLLVNPDDPVTAITDGIVFGAIHGLGAVKGNKAGYNDVKTFGGKPYESPVTKAFEETVNKASYSTLSNYAPDIYPALKPGESIPASAHDPAKVQEAVNSSIVNVTKKYLGMDSSPENIKKTSSVLKEYSGNIEKILDESQKQKLSLFDKFSIGKRREVTSIDKTQEAKIAEEFGKGYGAKSKLPETASEIPVRETMSLHDLFSEIKRITISGRQMYKGGLVGEMRGKADIDDLLSYGKALMNRKNNELNAQKTRFDSLRKNISQPNDIIPVVDAATKLFGKDSFNNSSRAESGKYPIKTGDVVITGAGINDINKANAITYFNAKRAGHADPKIVLTIRPDLKGTFELGNKILDPELIKNGSYSIDPHPEHAIQANATIYLIDPKTGLETGRKQILDLGMVASDARLNKNFNKDHLAFNLSKWVLEGKQPKLTPENHKDTIGDFMVKNNLDHLIVNIDPAATDVTVISKQPFILTNINDASIEASFKLRDALKIQPDTTPLSKDISKVKNSVDAKQIQSSIQKMKSKVAEPARTFLPKPETGEKNIHYASTNNVLQTMEKSLDVANPKELKKAFQDNLKWTLTDNLANELFNKRNELTIRNGIKLLVDAVNSGNVDAATKLKLQSTKTYLKSGILKFSPVGDAVLDLPILGKMKNTRFTGQEEHVITPTVQEGEPVNVSNTTKVGQSSNLTETPNVSVTEQTPGLAGKITKEYLNVKKPAKKNIQPERVNDSVVSSLSNRYIQEGKNIIEETKFGDRGYKIPKFEEEIAKLQKRIESDLKQKGVDDIVIKMVKEDVGNEMRNRAEIIIKQPTPDDLLEGHPVFEMMEQDRSGGLRPILTKEEAAKYFKSLGYTFKEPEFQKMGNASTFFPKIYDEDGSITKVGSILKEFTPKEFVELERPKFVAREFYKSIDDGIVSNEPKVKYFYKSLDAVLKNVVGKNYKDNIHLPKVLADFFNNKVYDEANTKGRERTQPKAVLEKRGVADFEGAKRAYSFRKSQVQSSPAKTGGGLSKKEISEKGLTPDISGKGFSGMTVSPEIQQRDMIHDLTRLEDMLSAIFSDAAKKNPATASVSAVRELYFGDKENIGLRQYLFNKLPNANKKTSVPFERLVKEAKVSDYKSNPKNLSDFISANIKKANEIYKKISTKSGEKQVYDPSTKKIETISIEPEIGSNIINNISKLEALEKIVKNFKEGEPLPTGITPEVVKDNVADILAKIKKYSELIKETENDGGGGPGYKYDGKGGMGSFFGELWDKLKNGNTYTYTYPSTQTIVIPPLDIDKYLKAISQIETGNVKGNPYKFHQPSGNPALGRALGKYQITEAELRKNMKRYIGSNTTPDQFLNSPDIQDKYAINQAKYRNSLGYTPQQIADFHRAGTGILNTPEGKDYYPGSQKYQRQDYVTKFDAIYSNPIEVVKKK